MSTRLLDLAVQEGWVQASSPSLEQLSSEDIFDYLLQQGLVDEQTLLDTLSHTYRWPRAASQSLCCDHHLSERVDYPKHCLPVYEFNDGICVAMHNPFADLSSLEAQYATIKKILMTRQDFYATHDPNTLDDGLTMLLTEAITRRASDIHLHWEGTGLEVTFRIDGQLKRFHRVAAAEAAKLVQIIKLEAHLDVGNFQHPQNGRLTWQHDEHDYDARISVVPTLNGEDIVIRVFYPNQSRRRLADCGFDAEAQHLIHKMLSQSNGFIVVTGPTGSGKTTTLYAMLRHLAQNPSLNIVSLEDPIESVIDGVHQSPVRQDQGYTYHEGLKSMLRQDPDVIMIGEIRDAQTAATALEAAYTGHLVLTTLHTGDIHGTLLRLLGFGLDPFMCRYALKGIVAQQLTPVLCDCETGGCMTCGFSGVTGRQLQASVLQLESPEDGSLDPKQWIAQGVVRRVGDH